MTRRARIRTDAIAAVAAVATLFAAGTASAGPTVKKKAWSTYTQLVDVGGEAGWGVAAGFAVLPRFECGEGESFRLLALQGMPRQVESAAQGRDFAQLGEWRVVLPTGGVPYSASNPADVGIGELAAVGQGAHPAEIRFDAGHRLTPIGPGVPLFVRVVTSAPMPTVATFTVVLTGACGTDGAVVVQPPRVGP